MNVLYIINSTEWIHPLIRDEILFFIKHDINIHIYIINSGENDRDNLDIENVIIINNHLQATKILNKIRYTINLLFHIKYLKFVGASTIKSLGKVFSYIKTQRINIIKNHFINNASIQACFLAKITGITLFVTGHNTDLLSRTDKELKHIIRESSYFHTISKTNQKYLQNRFPFLASKIHYHYIGISIYSKFKYKYKKIKYPIRLISVGWPIPAKGYEYLIKACDFLNRSDVKFICKIVGGNDSGSEKKELIRLVDFYHLSDKVILTKRLEHQAVLEELQNSDIYIQSSISEGIPVSLLEAMSYSLPIITTNLPGICEFMENDRSAVIVPEKNPSAIAAAVQKIFASESLQRRISKEAYKIVTTLFDQNQNMMKIFSIIKSVK